MFITWVIKELCLTKNSSGFIIDTKDFVNFYIDLCFRNTTGI